MLDPLHGVTPAAPLAPAMQLPPAACTPQPQPLTNDSDLQKHQSCSTVIECRPEGSDGAWGCLRAMAALKGGPWPPHAPRVSCCCTGGLARARHLHARAWT